MSIKIVKRQETRPAGNPNIGTKEMQQIIKKEEAIFMARQNQVDDSKTKREVLDDKTILYTFYDKSGKELYTRCDTPNTKGWNPTSIYAMKDESGNIVRYTDRGKDGTIEQMDYIENNGKGFLNNIFTAWDKNHDGNFDTGMPNGGNNAAKEFDIEV